MYIKIERINIFAMIEHINLSYEINLKLMAKIHAMETSNNAFRKTSYSITVSLLVKVQLSNKLQNITHHLAISD